MILKETTFNEIKKIIPEQVSDVHIEKCNKLMEILSSFIAESNGDLKCMNPLLIAEIYYMIFSEYRGNGYMTRALKLYIEYLISNFSEVNCIRAFIENDNFSSMMACKKNGFIEVGTIDDNMMAWCYQIR